MTVEWVSRSGSSKSLDESESSLWLRAVRRSRFHVVVTGIPTTVPLPNSPTRPNNRSPCNSPMPCPLHHVSQLQATLSSTHDLMQVQHRIDGQGREASSPAQVLVPLAGHMIDTRWVCLLYPQECINPVDYSRRGKSLGKILRPVLGRHQLGRR